MEKSPNLNIKNKGTLISIIALLAIFLPCTIIGMKDHFKEVNDKHLPYYEGSLYFYDASDKLLGTYKCQSSKCNLAQINIIDANNEMTSKIINNKYVFIEDNNIINIYSISDQNIIEKYNSVSTYSDLAKKNIYIVNKEGLTGIITTIPTISYYVEPKYSEIYLQEQEDNTHSLTTIAALNEKKYILSINNEEKKLAEIFQTDQNIEYFNDSFIIIKDDFDTITVQDYSGNSLIQKTGIQGYEVIKQYLIVKYQDSFTIYKINYAPVKEDGIYLDILKTYDKEHHYTITADGIDIQKGESIIEQITF